MRSDVPHCGVEGDYSCSRPRVSYADGGRLLRVHFGLSNEREWNQEHFVGVRDDEEKKKRDVCRGFSQGSRRRLLNHLNTISVAAPLPVFVTLTLPDDCFDDSVSVLAKRLKSNLDVWFKRLIRVCPQACGFWRIEWEARKSGRYAGKLMPHAHGMFWGIPERDSGRTNMYGEPLKEFYVDFPDEQQEMNFLSTLQDACLCRVCATPEEAQQVAASYSPVGRNHSTYASWSDGFCSAAVAPPRQLARLSMRLEQHRLMPEKNRSMGLHDWVAMSWYHVVGSNNTSHFLSGTRVERVRSWGGVMSYCSKYLAKLGDNNFLRDVAVGRSWGIFHRDAIPWAKMVELSLPDDVGVRLRRIARRYLEKCRGRRYVPSYGVTLYCVVSQWKRLWQPPPDTPF